MQALYNNTAGTNNSATAVDALRANTTGSLNTANGFQALYSNTTGWVNTSVGSNSLVSNTTGSYNTAVGYNTGPNTTNLDNTTCIGTDATASASNMVRIGNFWVGSIGGQVGWTTLSDGRFKENVREDIPGLAFINQLRPVSYEINREKVNDFAGVNKRNSTESANSNNSVDYKIKPLSATTTGFIAQEVEAAAKNIGFEFSGVDAPKNESDMYGLRYAEFVVPLVKAVQELAQQNEQLKAENARLEERLAAVENKLSGR